MPGLGWTEILIIAAIAIIVVGPKDLPILMRTIGRFMGKARALAREFQENFEEIAREAELEELRKENEKLRTAAMLPLNSLDALEPGSLSPPTASGSAPAAAPMTQAEEAALREATNAQVLAAEASAREENAAPLEPGGPAASAAAPDDTNVTPFRGGARR
jgi:sec-independent protein translocase protein TatB